MKKFTYSLRNRWQRICGAAIVMLIFLVPGVRSILGKITSIATNNIVGYQNNNHLNDTNTSESNSTGTPVSNSTASPKEKKSPTI